MSSEAPCDHCDLIYSHWRSLTDHYIEAHPGTPQAEKSAEWVELEAKNTAKGLVWADYVGWHNPQEISDERKRKEDERLRPVREEAWAEGYNAGLDAAIALRRGKYPVIGDNPYKPK